MISAMMQMTIQEFYLLCFLISSIGLVLKAKCERKDITPDVVFCSIFIALIPLANILIALLTSGFILLYSFALVVCLLQGRECPLPDFRNCSGDET
jgi:hypothetical protein